MKINYLEFDFSKIKESILKIEAQIDTCALNRIRVIFSFYVMKKHFYYFLILFCCFIQPAFAQVKSDSIVAPSKTDSLLRYKVVGIKDGDTFVVLMNGKEQVVRFYHIDCPEKSQAYGTVAKQFVSDHCFGDSVQLIHRNEYDRYNRLLAEVILENGTNLNKELVKNGLAWHYKQYSKSAEYAAIEETARANKIGLWSLANPIAPWDWRKKK